MHSACVRPLLLVPHHRPSMLARSIRLLCPRRVRAFSSAAAQVASPVDKSDGPPGPAAPLSDDQHRLLQVGIVGVPNAGKSTLTNALVGQKVSAVSSKTNTTHHCRLGAYTEGPRQVVIYDTPGVVGKECAGGGGAHWGAYFAGRHRQLRGASHETRVMSAWGVASNCDLILFILDAHRQIQLPDPRVVRLVQNLSKEQLDLPPAVLVLNKCEMVPREQRPALLTLADSLRQDHPFEETFWISALKGKGLPELRQYLLDKATPGQWTLDAGVATDRSEADMALEVVREKVFQRFHDELPYEITVMPVSFKVLKDGSLRAEMVLVVPSDGVKKIVVGKRGAAIKQVGTGARLELQKLWDAKVHLFLSVKVAKS